MSFGQERTHNGRNALRSSTGGYAPQRKCSSCGSSPAGFDDRCETCRSPSALVQRKAKDDEVGPDEIAEAAKPAATATKDTAPPAGATAPANAASASQGLIVDDAADALTSGQMRKTAFLDALRADACAAADRALAEAGRSTQGCPYVEKWLGLYARRPAAHLEKAILKYAPEARSVADAQAYLPIVSARIAKGAATWAQTGKLPADVPEDLQNAALGGMSGFLGVVGSIAETIGGAIGGLASAVGGLFAKGEGSGAMVDHGALSARLGEGRPLDTSVRGRMESALGADFSHVRVHTDPGAAGLSRDLDAHAFTVGNHVAFEAGEYQPGTLRGDALLAHELAHVEQQRHASDVAAQPARGVDSHERDADDAAVDVVSHLHGGAGATSRRSRRKATAGFQLQRCEKKKFSPLGKDEHKRAVDVDDYIEMWEQEEGHSISPEEKNILLKGCVGITALNLHMGDVPPPLTVSFKKFEQARTAQVAINAILDSQGAAGLMGNALNGHPVLKALRQELSAMASVVPFEAMGELRAVIFSVMFWSNQDPDVSARNAAVPGAFQPDERGMVKMPKSPNEILKRPNENMTGFYTNFDFAWWDETRNVWWDADRTALPTPEMPAQKMTIYEKDLQTLKQLPADFDRQVFSVALARRPTTTKK